jgi:hypothetical protein
MEPYCLRIFCTLISSRAYPDILDWGESDERASLLRIAGVRGFIGSG